MRFKGKKNISYLLFAALLSLDVLIMLFEKIAAINAQGDGILFYLSLLKQSWTWLAIGLAGVQLLVWTKILARTELSVAYPMASFSYPMTMFAAQLFLGEDLNLRIWFGALLITCGVGIVGSKLGKTGI